MSEGTENGIGRYSAAHSELMSFNPVYACSFFGLKKTTMAE